jgi:hypothetical protein
MKWVKRLTISQIILLTVGAHAQAQFGGGTGEPDDPLLIYTARQMNNIGANPDSWNKHFKLMADIDLSGFTGTDFNIIGYLNFNDSKSFTGVFDGNGHTISNFSYSTDAPDAAGLFGYGIGIQIKNLGLIDPNVEAGEAAKVGALIGQMDVGVITNCYVQNGNVSGLGYVGGLVGSTFLPAIADCNVSATVFGWDTVGGLAGDNFGGTIVNCRSVSTVLGIWRIGGLVGTNDFTTMLGMFFPSIIAECCSEGITEGLDSVGGLVGDNYCLVTNSYTAAGVGGVDRVGGLVGYNFSGQTYLIGPRYHTAIR